MSSKLAHQVAAVALACMGLTAQNVTLPAVMDGVEGGSGTNVPFGSNLSCRYQAIYEAAELPWVGPRQITGISLRADNGDPNTPGNAIPAKGYLIVSVLMSTTHASASAASGTFEDNRGEDRQWVINTRSIQLPAQPVTSVPGPRPANIDLVFTTPWWYGLTPARPNLPAPENLLVEIWIHSQPSGSYPIDNLGGCVAVTTSFGNQGPLCAIPATPTPLQPVLRSDPSMTAGGSFSWYVDQGPANAPFVLALAATSQGALFGNPLYQLPYPMFDPLNPSLPSAALASMQRSAPDCWFNLDPVLTLFGTCDAAGNGVIPTQLPAGRGYVGFELFAQAILYAQTANPLQVVSTLGRSSTICGPLGVARIFAFYNGPSAPVPTSGSVQYGLAPVIEVQ